MRTPQDQRCHIVLGVEPPGDAGGALLRGRPERARLRDGCEPQALQTPRQERRRVRMIDHTLRSSTRR